MFTVHTFDTDSHSQLSLFFVNSREKKLEREREEMWKQLEAQKLEFDKKNLDKLSSSENSTEPAATAASEPTSNGTDPRR